MRGRRKKMPVVCTIIASLSLSLLCGGPSTLFFLSLSSRRRRRRRRPISFIQLTPDGEDWDNENEETASLFFVLCLFSAAASGERERKTRKLRNCARKSFSFTPRLFLHACYFSWPVCCLPETGISRRKNIFFFENAHKTEE